MKKFIAGLSFVLVTISSFAQEKINEGIVVYSLEWDVPPQAQAMASSLPSELNVYFKGDSSSMKIESQFFSSKSILNTAKEYERLLLDIPMAGKKYSVIFTPADQEKMLDQMPQMELKASAETKTILGYQAKKYEVNESKTGKNFTAWFTKEVSITANPMSRFYEASFGFPLEFLSFQNGIPVKATVKEIKKVSVPAGSFGADKDYEEISYSQLMQMSGR